MKEITRKDLEDELKYLDKLLTLSHKSWLTLREMFRMCETEEEREEISYFTCINEKNRLRIIKGEKKIQALLDLDVERIMIEED